jgi:muramoyltetrapeptide carboxypeptidase
MPDRVKPSPVRPGATLGVPASASPVYDRRELDKTVAALRAAGYEVVLGEHVDRRRGYLAGSPQERVADLHALFADERVDAVVELRGGYGSADVLPLLDFELIARNPKPFVGMSDITMLHAAIGRETGLVTFWGPMARALADATNHTWNGFQRALGSTEPLGPVAPDPDDPLVQALVPGSAEGALIGGTTTLLAATLGTPWEIETEGRIVFLEDVDDEPYRLDRALTQLIQAGKLGAAAGIVLAEHVDIKPSRHLPAFGGHSLDLDEIFERLVVPLGVPTLRGLPLGHGRHLATLPLGVRARLDADGGVLEVLESGVSDS